jgi:LemA protein
MVGGVVMIFLLIVLGVAVVAVLWFIGAYNSLVRLRNQVKNAWAQIDVQLKRRHDLIPNLVETAKGYMQHERGTLEAVTKARNLAAQASGAGQASQAEQGLSSALGQFFVVVERYPDLKANQNFLALQEELSSTENKIGFARQFYNDQVMQYNIRIQSFPANTVAGMFHFMQMDLFEIQAAEERAVPQVKF